MEDVPNLINIGLTNPIQILNQHELFLRFCLCPSNDSFDKKILISALGLNSKDRKSTRDEANISNPKVNRSCAPLTTNRISADCVQISLGPSIPYIPLGVYHTRGFNAIRVWNARLRIFRVGNVLELHNGIFCILQRSYYPIIDRKFHIDVFNIYSGIKQSESISMRISH